MKKFFVTLLIGFICFVPLAVSAQTDEYTILEKGDIKVRAVPATEEEKSTTGFEYKLVLDYQNEEYLLSKGFADNNEDFIIWVENKGVIYPSYIDASGYELDFFDIQGKKVNNINPFSLQDSGLTEYFWFSDFQLSPSNKYLSIFIESTGLHQTCIYSLDVLPEVKVFCPLKLMADNQNTTSVDEMVGNTWHLTWNLDDTFTFYYTSFFFWESDKPLEETMEYISKDVWQADANGNNLEKISTIAPELDFKDIEVNNNLFSLAQEAKSQGWLSGYPDGTLRPNDPVNRAEFAKMVIKAFGETEIPIAPGMVNIYPDVPATAWYSSTLYTALKLAIMTGYPDGLARPENNINKVEGLRVVLEMLDKDYTYTEPQYNDTASDQWYSGYTSFSYNQEPSLLPADDFNNLNPGDKLTRGEAIELISKTLQLQ